MNGTFDPIAASPVGAGFETLANPSMIGMLYFVLFVIFSLKTACFRRPFYRATVYWYCRRIDCERRDGLSANDSAADVAASLGCWVSYIQGRWLGNTAPYKTGYLIYPRIIINAHTTFS